MYMEGDWVTGDGIAQPILDSYRQDMGATEDIVEGMTGVRTGEYGLAVDLVFELLLRSQR